MDRRRWTTGACRRADRHRWHDKQVTQATCRTSTGSRATRARFDEKVLDGGLIEEGTPLFAGAGQEPPGVAILPAPESLADEMRHVRIIAGAPLAGKGSAFDSKPRRDGTPNATGVAAPPVARRTTQATRRRVMTREGR